MNDISTTPKIDFNPQALKDAIEEMGITQKEFAERAGFNHRNYVTKLLKGKKIADVKDLGIISLLTGKPMEFFTTK